MGCKVAATLASTGTPAMFVHSAEASHGDLGMITPADVVLTISNSGESDELTVLLPVLKRMNIPPLTMTVAREHLGPPCPSGARHQCGREACPLNLAPTASTDGADATMGDALAVVDARGLPDDLASQPPGGALGRKLLTHVRDADAQARRGARASASATVMPSA